ncbi:MAG: ATP-dependent sacrificial sulfur transferase LarE [Candidatus Thorarchaeota archaeon]
MDKSVRAKFDRVRSLLRGERVLVAFSGGVDSATLALLSKEVAAKTVLLTVASVTFLRSELELARRVAQELDLPIRVVEVDQLANQGLVKNPVDRCYHCKKELASVWLEHARLWGLDMVVDGTNASDVQGHRPGARALQEAGVVSPFKETGITKNEIREFAREHGLSVADRPPMACLSSRFPYGTEITEERVRMVESVEQAVREMFDVECVRARFHGEVVRIEVGRHERERLFDVKKLDRLAAVAKSVGFRYVTFDVEGYRTGAMDEVLEHA